MSHPSLKATYLANLNPACSHSAQWSRKNVMHRGILGVAFCDLVKKTQNMTLMPDWTHAVDKLNPGFLLNPHILTFSFETGWDESYRDTGARFGPLVHCCSYPMCQLNKPIKLVSQPRDFLLSQPFQLLIITVMDYQHLIQGCWE